MDAGIHTLQLNAGEYFQIQTPGTGRLTTLYRALPEDHDRRNNVLLKCEYLLFGVQTEEIH